MLFVVRCLLLVGGRCLWFVVCCSLLVVCMFDCCLLCVVCGLLFDAVRWRLLFGVCISLFVVCCCLVLYAVGGVFRVLCLLRVGCCLMRVDWLSLLVDWCS